MQNVLDRLPVSRAVDFPRLGSYHSSVKMVQKLLASELGILVIPHAMLAPTVGCVSL